MKAQYAEAKREALEQIADLKARLKEQEALQTENEISLADLRNQRDAFDYDAVSASQFPFNPSQPIPDPSDPGPQSPQLATIFSASASHDTIMIDTQQALLDFDEIAPTLPALASHVSGGQFEDVRAHLMFYINRALQDWSEFISFLLLFLPSPLHIDSGVKRNIDDVQDPTQRSPPRRHRRSRSSPPPAGSSSI